MKLFAALLVIAATAGFFFLVWGVWTVSKHAERRKGSQEWLRRQGMPPKAGVLYRSAAEILVDLNHSCNDLNAMTTGDILSHQTREKVTAWVAEYRKEDTRA